MLGFLSLSLFS